MREKEQRSRSDYTKILMVQDMLYLDSSSAVIDQDKFRETMMRLDKIKADAFRFVEDYKAHIRGTQLLHPEFATKKGRETLDFIRLHALFSWQTREIDQRSKKMSRHSKDYVGWIRERLRLLRILEWRCALSILYVT